MRCKENVYNCYDLATCFREKMQFALNKQLEHFKLQQCAQSQSMHPGCLVVHTTVQLYMSAAFKTNQTLSA